MLRTIAQFCVTRPKSVLAGVLILLILCIAVGANVSERLGVAGFADPDSESSRASEFIDEKFGSTPNLVIEITTDRASVDDPGVVALAEATQNTVTAEPSAAVVTSYWRDQVPDLRSDDGRSALIMVRISGTEEQAARAAGRIIDSLPSSDSGVVNPGGLLGLQVETEKRVSGDLAISESIALPLTLIFLVVVFGGLVAAVLPIALGISSIVAALGMLAVLTRITDVSVHALTVATAFGLGLSIDFGLLMISRFREERASGLEHNAAIVETVASAGRTIGFSAATVALAMGGLLVFPTYFLRSVGIAASIVVLLSALSAITVLPALLALLGSRVDSLRILRRAPVSAESAFWRRCAQVVLKRPLTIALPVIAVLLALGIPFLHAQFATPDERALPKDSPTRLVTESLRENYPIDDSSALTIVSLDNAALLDEWAGPISQLPGIARVDGSFGSFEGGEQVSTPVPASVRFESGESAYALVHLSVNAQSDAARELVADIRTDFTSGKAEIGGPSAVLVDSRQAVTDNLGLAILIMAVSTFILLFLFTGSVIVPIKALFLNVFVLSAVLGMMVLIFQDGYLAELLGITPSPLGLPMVVLLCCISFSLSVDYEIFLLSRIKEARDSGLSNDAAVVAGLSKVGRIISSAAILLTITLVSFANGLSFMKMFGIGTALAVVLDATIIRGVVVPAFLKVAGELNWWAPGPLKRFHQRFGLHESAPASAEMPSREVEILPGRHLIAASAGATVVVAHRESGPPSEDSPAARLMASLLEVVRRKGTDGRALAVALAEIAAQEPDHHDFGVVFTSRGGLTVFLRGAVTSTLEGAHGSRTVLECLDAHHGDCYHVPMPAGPVMIGIREEDHEFTGSTDGADLIRLSGGIAPGQGAMLWPVTLVTPPPPPSVQLPPEDQTEVPAPVTVQTPGFVVPPPGRVRPPIGSIVFDDGTAFEFDGDCLVGRAPAAAPSVLDGPRTIDIDDPRLSRTHAAIRAVNGQIYVVDHDSRNGVWVRTSSDLDWERIGAWTPTAWQPGTEVRIGDQTMRLELLTSAGQTVTATSGGVEPPPPPSPPA